MTNMEMTGQNLLYAFGMGVSITFVISVVFALIGTLDSMAHPQDAPGTGSGRLFVNIFVGGLLCYGLPTFLAAFALLQRFRVKPPDNDGN
jgi:hypothetical protein